MVRVTSTKLCIIQNAGLVVGIFMLDVRVLNGGIIVLHKKLLKELDGQGRLSNTSITNHHKFVRYLLVGLCTSGFFPSSSSIPTISTRVDFLFSVNYCCLFFHQKLFYIYYIYVLTCYCHLFSIVVS